MVARRKAAPRNEIGNEIDTQDRAERDHSGQTTGEAAVSVLPCH